MTEFKGTKLRVLLLIMDSTIKGGSMSCHQKVKTGKTSIHVMIVSKEDLVPAPMDLSLTNCLIMSVQCVVILMFIRMPHRESKLQRIFFILWDLRNTCLRER